MGWVFHKPYYPRLKTIDVSDLLQDPIVKFQHRWYPLLAFTCSFLLPTCIVYDLLFYPVRLIVGMIHWVDTCMVDS